MGGVNMADAPIELLGRRTREANKGGRELLVVVD